MLDGKTHISREQCTVLFKTGGDDKHPPLSPTCEYQYSPPVHVCMKAMYTHGVGNYPGLETKTRTAFLLERNILFNGKYFFLSCSLLCSAFVCSFSYSRPSGSLAKAGGTRADCCHGAISSGLVCHSQLRLIPSSPHQHLSSLPAAGLCQLLSVSQQSMILTLSLPPSLPPSTPSPR